MNKRLVMKPAGWPCRLIEAPPGPFIPLEETKKGLESKPGVCMKTEYGVCEAYNSAGERFCGDGEDHVVQPLMGFWEETE